MTTEPREPVRVPDPEWGAPRAARRTVFLTRSGTAGSDTAPRTSGAAACVSPAR